MVLIKNKTDVSKRIDLELSITSESLGVEISDNVIELLVDDIMDKYRHDSMEDVLIAIKNIRQGNVMIYGRLNMETITRAMTEQLELKAAEREKELSDFKRDVPEWSHDEYLEIAKKSAAAQKKESKKSAAEKIKEAEYENFKADYLKKSKKK